MANQTRIAFVTGANKGMGLEIARQLAQAGIQVLVGSRDPERGRAAVAKLTAAGLAAQRRDPSSPYYSARFIGYNASKAALNMLTVQLALCAIRVVAGSSSWLRWAGKSPSRRSASITQPNGRSKGPSNQSLRKSNLSELNSLSSNRGWREPTLAVRAWSPRSPWPFTATRR